MNIYLEMFGYVGTALVLLSMMMTSVVKLRLLNMAGSVISMTYAVLCGAWPVVFLNAGLILINLYRLLHLRRTDAAFRISPDSSPPTTPATTRSRRPMWSTTAQRLWGC